MPWLCHIAIVTPACKSVLEGSRGSVLICSAGPLDMSETKSCFVRDEKMHPPGVHSGIMVYLFGSVFWVNRIWEAGLKGPFGLIPYLPQDHAREFLSFQRENK